MHLHKLAYQFKHARVLRYANPCHDDGQTTVVRSGQNASRLLFQCAVYDLHVRKSGFIDSGEAADVGGVPASFLAPCMRCMRRRAAHPRLDGVCVTVSVTKNMRMCCAQFSFDCNLQVDCLTR